MINRGGTLCKGYINLILTRYVTSIVPEWYVNSFSLGPLCLLDARGPKEEASRKQRGQIRKTVSIITHFQPFVTALFQARHKSKDVFEEKLPNVTPFRGLRHNSPRSPSHFLKTDLPTNYFWVVIDSSLTSVRTSMPAPPR